MSKAMLTATLAVAILCPADHPAVLAQEMGHCAPYPGDRGPSPDSAGHRVTAGSPRAGYLGFTHDMGLRALPGGRVEIGDHPRVKRVYCDSPAAKGGLMPGDLILRVNEMDSRMPGAFSVERPGLVLDVVVERDGVVQNFTLISVQHPALRTQHALTAVRDSAGIEIVENRNSSGMPSQLRLSDLKLQIGSREGNETAFHRIIGTTRLADGRIVVGNAGTGEIRVFGPAGDFLNAAGGAGDAPGEFLDLAAMHQSNNGTLSVYDYRTRRISVFDDDLTLQQASSLRAPSVGPERDHPLFAPVGWLSAGVLVLRRDLYQKTMLSHDPEAVVVRQPISELHLFGSDGRAIGTAGSWPGTKSVMRVVRGGRGGLSIASVPMPFMDRFEAVVVDDMIVVASTDAYEIYVHEAGGRLIRIVRKLVEPRAVGADARGRWVEAQLADAPPGRVGPRIRKLYEELPFPTVMPAFRSLAAQRGGRLWVEAYQPASVATGESLWDVFSEEGALASQATLPAGFRPHEIGLDYVLGVWKDEWGVEYVQLYDLEMEGPG